MNQIAISDLPETIQTLVNQVQISGNSLTITQNGVPLAVIQPIQNKVISNDNDNLLQLCEKNW